MFDAVGAAHSLPPGPGVSTSAVLIAASVIDGRRARSLTACLSCALSKEDGGARPEAGAEGTEAGSADSYGW